MGAKIPSMDYRQYRAACRLVHECCNYDNGNCILLDNGEPCICVQSISYSLLCRWFAAAVLPLDGKLEAALLRRADRKRCTECGGYFLPKSNRGKYCPDCAAVFPLSLFSAENGLVTYRKAALFAAVRPYHPLTEERLAGQ